VAQFHTSKEGAEKSVWYREEGIDDREVLFTGWIVDARTIIVSVHTKNWGHVISFIPDERMHVVCSVKMMLCDCHTTKCLKYM
jgi:hypothetical protein